MVIASIVTAQGSAAVSIIKISGEGSWSIAEKLTGKQFTHRFVEIAWITHENKKIDQAIILPFKSPNSYTGEDLIEIQLHGGFWITEYVLELILAHGARLARPGEFTQKAVLNHKIDLSQAEAIMDLIEANSSISAQNAIKIYQGELGNSIKLMRNNLLNILGEVTASIDFPDEVGNYDPSLFKKKVQEVIQDIDSLLAGEKEGHILRNGYKIAIVGKPNAGKSTLLNTLLKKERAIVTNIAGTTRDIIEESYSLKGIPVVLLDTAGIRQSDDLVEKIGIQKSFDALLEADLVLNLVDLSTDDDKKDFDYVSSGVNILTVGTKLDMASRQGLTTDLDISAHENINIEELKKILFEKISNLSKNKDLIKINHRQADLLRQAKNSLEESLAATTLSEDFWTIDLRTAIHSLGEITGETLTEEILDNIFSRFCIGK
jgi:tRNA modification GTPase